MKNFYQQLFKRLPIEEPSADLLTTIMRRIDLETIRQARQQIWLSSLAGIFSLIVLVPAIKLLANDFINSGFYNYITLIWSDKTIITTYWKDFTLSLLESLPVTSIMLTLSAFIAGLISLKSLTSNRSTLLKTKNS